MRTGQIMNNRSKLNQTALFGMKIPPGIKHDMKIGRWKVFQVESNVMDNTDKLVIAYQIQSNTERERILLRIILNNDFEIEASSSMFIRKNVDEELGYYVIMSLLMRLSKTYPFSTDHKLTEN